ncbi:MAG: pyridoxamine 5'-phosphate oxidase [Myxococcota bacterium]
MSLKARNPLVRFRQALERAEEAEPFLANAVVLATADASGRPSARTVLLKDVDERGVTFFTNRRSRKAVQIEENPRVSISVYWKSTDEQVLIEGEAVPLSDEESDAYFATRPRESQLGAWASDQSRFLESREKLLERFEEEKERFEGRPVERPPHWGGYRVLPDHVEFWQRGDHRLHDRFLYLWEGERWSMKRLYP